MAPSKSSYWSAVRDPRYSLLYALPLLLAYEGLAWAMGQTGYTGVRNGADVLLKSLFLSLGGRHGLTIFTAVVLGTGLILVARDIRRRGLPRLRFFAGMVAESVLYALALGTVAGVLTTFLLTGRLATMMAQGGSEVAHLTFPVQLMVSLGAGIYEELVFRVLLVSGLAALGGKVLGWKPVPAGIFAAVLGALIFSAFHYVGPLGDPFQVGSFTFRAIAGLLFSGMYLLRGFGITAWSHALYDVFLAVGG
ncbi:MAG TPA: CPBP family intramembrane glutamic endopeptidase [Gemmatimonadales bacterium]|nr:CPBP family intramembrane glutamic endopeptidase [Gemmatimonadales bacterium]